VASDMFSSTQTVAVMGIACERHMRYAIDLDFLPWMQLLPSLFFAVTCVAHARLRCKTHAAKPSQDVSLKEPKK
jgi:hypothetical protein